MRTFSENKDLITLRRKQIAVSAAHILATKGYDRMTVKEVATACDMPMGMLYHYIGSKEDILTLVLAEGTIIYKDFFKDTAEAVRTMHPKEAVKKGMEDFYRLVDEHKDFTITTYMEVRVMTKIARTGLLNWDKYVIELFEQMLKRGCESGVFKQHNTKLLAQNIVTSGEMWAIRQWYFRDVFTFDEYIREMTKVVFDLIIAKPRKTVSK
jgi:AcrR family transcriptional regulator